MNVTEDRRTSRWTSPWWSLALFLAFLVLYQLSVGPVAWLSHHDRLPETALLCAQVVYAPIGMAASNCKWYGNLIDQYLLLWGVEH